MREVAEAMNAFVSSALDGLHVSAPGRVESYDATKQRASVQPLIRRAYTDADGARATELLPIINDVPVVFPGSGLFSITWPIAKGDIVLLVFADQSLDRWLPRGGIVDPADDRSHAMSDAIAIPGLRPFSAPVSGAPAGGSGAAGAMVIGTPGELHLGQGALTDNDKVAKKSDLQLLFSAFENAVTTPNDGGANFKATLLASLESAGWPICASKVRAK